MVVSRHDPRPAQSACQHFETGVVSDVITPPPMPDRFLTISDAENFSLWQKSQHASSLHRRDCESRELARPSLVAANGRRGRCVTRTESAILMADQRGIFPTASSVLEGGRRCHSRCETGECSCRCERLAAARLSPGEKHREVGSGVFRPRRTTKSPR